MAMEHKSVVSPVRIVDEDEGIVEMLFAVYGNVDSGNDRAHPGMFNKSLKERGNRIRVLDMHKTDSVMRAIGVPLVDKFREIKREELPPEVLMRHPDATGGAVMPVQFLMNTPEGRGAFERIKAGAISEYSFGYEPKQVDYSSEVLNGKNVKVRNLRQVALYEIGPVLFGMNDATATLSAKSNEVTIMEQGPIKMAGDGGAYRIYQNGEAIFESEEYQPAEERFFKALLDIGEAFDEKAVWTVAYINDLPDSAFLYIEPGHEKDEEGKTVPRSARHFPYRNAQGEIDLPHLRNAIARIPQSNAPGLDADKKRQLQERARRLLEEAQKESAAPETMEGKAIADERLPRLKQRLVGDTASTLQGLMNRLYADGFLDDAEYEQLRVIAERALDILRNEIEPPLSERTIPSSLHMGNAPAQTKAPVEDAPPAASPSLQSDSPVRPPDGASRADLSDLRRALEELGHDLNNIKLEV